MTEHGVMTEEATAQSLPLEPLEERVRRLEDTVAVLQDTRHLEDRVVERVASRLGGNTSTAIQESSGLLAQMGRKVLPAALEASRQSTETAENSGPVSPPPVRQPWVFFELYHELRSMVRMYLDRRYRASLMARVVPIVALTIFLFSWFFIDSMRIIGPLLDKIVDLILICVVYKVLSREVQRYGQAVGHLPPLQRF
jgi:hypothetical protein